MDLYQYFLSNTGRNILKNPHYFPIYERHFSKFKNHAPVVFEIGTGDGGSCRMWKHYFGASARIVTIDINDKSAFEEAQIFPRKGSQADPKFLQDLVAEFGPPDIVMDDGSHMQAHIYASFSTLCPMMSTKGVYLVEDLDGAYWPQYGGGYLSPQSFIERSKILIDEMNAGFSLGKVSRSDCGKNILSISFYPMIVVIERTPSLNIRMLRIPEPLPQPSQ